VQSVGAFQARTYDAEIYSGDFLLRALERRSHGSGRFDICAQRVVLFARFRLRGLHVLPEIRELLARVRIDELPGLLVRRGGDEDTSQQSPES
jgi:hypothetical protein